MFTLNNKVLKYSVINKEGHKPLKKCDFDAFKRFIASKNMGHFDIWSKLFQRWA